MGASLTCEGLSMSAFVLKRSRQCRAHTAVFKGRLIYLGSCLDEADTPGSCLAEDAEAGISVNLSVAAVGTHVEF